MHRTMQKFFIVLILLANYCDGFIAPVEIHRWQENLFVIPSILKGLDSRLGFGFRLGNHADFQSIFEIGPQKVTKPLEKRAEEEYSSNKKRMASRKYHGEVAKFPSNGSNSTKYYINKRSFSTKNQYPLPKSLKNEKSLQIFAAQKYKSQRKLPSYRLSPKTSRMPTALKLSKSPVKLKKIQRIKDDLGNVTLVD